MYSMKKKLPPSRMISIQPFDYQDFDSRIEDLRSYCKIIKKQKIKDQILMKNQLIVTLSTTLEVKLKEFISHLIDKWDIPAKNLFSERSIEIKLEVLDHLDKSSSNIEGANGRKLSRYLTFKFNLFCIFDDLGSAKIDLPPNALGPNSILP